MLSQQNLAEKLDVARTTLGDYERENTEPNIEMLLKISDYFQKDLKALLSKDLSLEDYEVSKTSEIRILAITVDNDNEGNIELVETKAEAGYLDSYFNPEFIRDLPRIRFPGLDQGTYRGFEISGDSMLPVEPGSIVICSYVEKLEELKDGKTYVIISRKEGIVYKRVKVDNNKKCLILVSDNQLYLPYEVSFEDIDEVWKYYAHLSFNDSQKSAEVKIESQLNALNQKIKTIQEDIGRISR